ncbi:type III restriction protein res subunit [Thiorhodococcus drewsii AZ1]|uniref:Type III restriction protein res subunit n=1 Tax=Thiorhodococcus drewsii AZ1 TaxID=765913 RepID=G2E4L3_9GAMM|nr:DEAD/DEAH box helicase family protein [Thiorhodococcus drewsii]EGV29634.1 type III restriction protein res subunit [Thiorhodococcus drewsii AZ1]
MAQYLTTGGARDPFLPHLLGAIRQATEIDLAVAFIKSSGLALLYPALVDAIEIRGVRLRVLTSDYLDVTDPHALRRLLLLAERGADIRLFETDRQSFHLKAYICVRSQQSQTLWGAAFIGSSNISRTALTDGMEWNVRIDQVDEGMDLAAGRFREIRAEYQTLIDHPAVRSLDHDWIDAYEQRRQLLQRLPIAPGSDEPEEPPPQPTNLQQEALAALSETRRIGFQRGLVVMATGLGKTYLAAFDSERMGASRILFVAHREEILLQAEDSFQRVQPRARIGRYDSARKDMDVDLLFASVQTLGQTRHLEGFAPDHFEYVVVDEFHHAAAPTYRRLLAHFRPRFLLGLTATPERTDQSDILSLCDDNLVYSRHLFDGVELGLLSPFHYFGIFDETVDYQEIPWRNGRFDPEALSNKLATLARARHALRHWRDKGQQRTLAFCVSRRHADFMAERFQGEGIRAAAVYQGSTLERSAALEQLERGDLQVIFSVDLFNEGVDLPAIDTVLMLRPTESKVLFLQQLGRGLRRHPTKAHLVVLDFIGNHRGFLNKPQALFEVGSSYSELASFGRRARDGELKLPAGCFANYDLAVIEFLIRLQGRGPAAHYQALRDSLGRRPTLSEFYRSDANLPDLRRQHGQWWALVRDQGDLTPEETECLAKHEAFLREVETSNMMKSFKAVLLESLLHNDGFRQPPRIEDLATQALEVFRRRRHFVRDIRQDLQQIDSVDPKTWLKYWKSNPVNAWIGGNKKTDAATWFELSDGYFRPTFQVSDDEMETFQALVQELVDYRLATYEPRLTKAAPADPVESTKHSADIIPIRQPMAQEDEGIRLPFFPNLGIACGHFRSGRTDVETTCRIGENHGRLDPTRHFVARAVGDSMNGGKQPIRDGDYLLLELLDPSRAGSITGSLVVIERQDVSGEDQYLLRRVTKGESGQYVLRAANPDYPNVEATEDLRTLAQLRATLASSEVQMNDDRSKAT